MASVLISGTHPLPHLDKTGEYDAGDRDDDDDDGDGDGDGDDEKRPSNLCSTSDKIIGHYESQCQ